MLAHHYPRKKGAKTEQNTKNINEFNALLHPSKLKVAGSIPAGVANKINMLYLLFCRPIFPENRIGNAMGRLPRRVVTVVATCPMRCQAGDNQGRARRASHPVAGILEVEA
jgi:hypothetical protein